MKTSAKADRWRGSPFEWIMTLPSRQKGMVAEMVVANWLESQGFEVKGAAGSGHDRVVNGIPTEIKMSTLWESGVYKFQQLRDQDYSVVILAGLSPEVAHVWIVPKAVAWKHAVPQHGGSVGVDTRWLSFAVTSPPPWLVPYGGELSRASEVAHQIFGS